MEAKLELVDSIENIKEKLTSQEYKEILENLAKIPVREPNIPVKDSSSEEETSSEEEEEEEEEETSSEEEEEEETSSEEEEEEVNLPSIPSRREIRPRRADDPKYPGPFYPGPFYQTIKISTELSTFLGIDASILVTRLELTSYITKYIKDHNLQKEENKRIIDLSKPGGEQLRILFGIPDDGVLTFFNLQNYLKIHVIKA